MGFNEARAQDVALQVRKARLSLLAKSAVRSVPANVLNCLILSAILFEHVYLTGLLVWIAALIVFSFARLGVMWRAHKNDKYLPTDKEMNAYLALTVATGTAWGLSPFLLMPDASMIASKAVVIVVAGMAAGCAGSVSDRRSVLAFIGPAVGLLAIYTLMQGGWQSYVLTGLIALFGVMLSLITVNGTTTLVEALEANIKLKDIRRETSEQAEAMSRLADYNDAAAKRAEQKVQASAAVLANMSHELRTPLNSVVGMAHLLQHSGLDDEKQLMANRIVTSSERLEQLLTSVLEVSRIEAGRMDLNLQDVSCEMVASRLQTKFQSRIEATGLQFTIAFDDSCDLCVRGDIERITQLASIYIDNALGFTHEGGLTVKVSIKAKDATDRASLRIDVVDTGTGVPEGLRADLFDAFLDETLMASMRESGTGLGLHLAKRLAHFMNGDVGYMPNDEQGSIFWFEIDAKISHYVDRFADGEEHTIDRRKLRILTCEANPSRQSVLLGNLKALDCVVSCASSLSELKDHLNTAAYDAIVVGLALDGCDVDMVSHEIRHLASTASMTPVVRLSHDLDKDVLQTPTEVLISSPISNDVLKTGLERAMNKQDGVHVGLRDAS